MSENVNISIDDRTLSVPKGANVLDSALKAGIDISYFCYHPGLSIAACCRQCLVEVAGNPKLQPSCQLTAADGLKIISSSQRVLLAREQMLEFTAVNHPVDCPICDKAASAAAAMYFELGRQAVAPEVLTKVRKPKRVDLGPTDRPRSGALHPLHSAASASGTRSPPAPARDGQPRRPRGADHRARPAARQSPTR
jgi:NADH-quinone oxidoreductase subunit G